MVDAAPPSGCTTERSAPARLSRALCLGTSTNTSARRSRSRPAPRSRALRLCCCSSFATIQSKIPMREILVTNDDGVHSEGIKTLAAALGHFGNVTIVAPMQEASAIGHALTLRRPLRIETIGPKTYGIDGTPTDCVNLAISHIIKQKPDLIVSGINKGWNLGDDVTYSGTVSGALEGALLGIPAIAVSLRATTGVYDFGPSARVAFTLAGALLQRPLPSRTFLNINLPHG